MFAFTFPTVSNNFHSWKRKCKHIGDATRAQQLKIAGCS